MGYAPWKILTQLTIVSSLSLAFARAEESEAYVSNLSNVDLFITNITMGGQATPADLYMGLFQPSVEGWRQPLLSGGHPACIHPGNTVSLTLETEPESTRAAVVTLTQEGRLVGTLQIRVWRHGLASRTVANMLQQDPQADGTFYGEENLFIFLGFTEPQMSNGW